MMKQRRSRRAGRRSRPRGDRQWRLPPVLTRGPHETIDRLGILDEHEAADAVLLWRGARDIELWAAAPPEARGRLFAVESSGRWAERVASAALAPEVSRQLAALGAMLRGPDAGGEDVASASALIARWARERGARETAVAFAQAAALAAPDDPAHALLTGICARELAQAPRAATWLQRSVSLARRARDRLAYADASLALADLAASEGDAGGAWNRALRAFRVARHAAARIQRGTAARLLFRLARAAGHAEATDRYARVGSRLAATADARDAEAVLELAEHWLGSEQPELARSLLRRLGAAERLAADLRFAAAVLRVRAEIAAHAPGAARRALAEAAALIVVPPVEPGALVEGLLRLARCAAELGDGHAFGRLGKAALTHAPAERYREVRSALEAIEVRRYISMI